MPRSACSRMWRHAPMASASLAPQHAAPMAFEQVAVLAVVQRAGLLSKFPFEQPLGRQEVVLVSERGLTA